MLQEVQADEQLRGMMADWWPGLDHMRSTLYPEYSLASLWLTRPIEACCTDIISSLGSHSNSNSALSWLWLYIAQCTKQLFSWLQQVNVQETRPSWYETTAPSYAPDTSPDLRPQPNQRELKYSTSFGNNDILTFRSAFLNGFGWQLWIKYRFFCR